MPAVIVASTARYTAQEELRAMVLAEFNKGDRRKARRIMRHLETYEDMGSDAYDEMLISFEEAA